MAEVGYKKPPKHTQFKKGQSGNPAGRTEGSFNFTTIIAELAADEKLADMLWDKKPEWWKSLPNKNAANAIVAAMFIKAANGDSKAAEWVGKYWQGSRVTLANDPENPLTAQVITPEVAAGLSDDIAKMIMSKTKAKQPKAVSNAKPAPRQSKS